MKTALMLRELDDYETGLQEHYGFSCSESGCQKTYCVPADIGQGTIKTIYPSDDVGLSIIHLRLNYPLVMNYEGYDSRFETTYCLKGHIVYSETGVVDTSLGQNDMGIYIKPQSRGMMMFPSGEEILAVSLMGQNGFLDSLPFRKESLTCSASEARTIADTLLHPRKTSVHLGNQFAQIAREEVDNTIATYFYDGAAKLVLSSLWQEYIIGPQTGIANFTLTPFERTALHEVRDILFQRYAQPPTIPQLAKLVSLNEYRLKQGFRELFGKTIHEFSRELKMANAKALLENRDLTISQIAYEVGYLNVSHFTRAFRKEHGINPSDFRL